MTNCKIDIHPVVKVCLPMYPNAGETCLGIVSEKHMNRKTDWSTNQIFGSYVYPIQFLCMSHLHYSIRNPTDYSHDVCGTTNPSKKDDSFHDQRLHVRGPT